MKMKFAILALLAGFSFSATAEDRLHAGYNVGDTSVDSWVVTGEKNLFDVGPATVYVDGAAARIVGDENAQLAAGGGVQFALNDEWSAKFGIVNNFADKTDDFLTYKAGIVYGGDAWRFAGSVLKIESFDPVAELTAERKLFGDLGFGIGTLFNENDYISTQAFVSYSF